MLAIALGGVSSLLHHPRALALLLVSAIAGVALAVFASGARARSEGHRRRATRRVRGAVPDPARHGAAVGRVRAIRRARSALVLRPRVDRHRPRRRRAHAAHSRDDGARFALLADGGGAARAPAAHDRPVCLGPTTPATWGRGSPTWARPWRSPTRRPSFCRWSSAGSFVGDCGARSGCCPSTLGRPGPTTARGPHRSFRSLGRGPPGTEIPPSATPRRRRIGGSPEIGIGDLTEGGRIMSKG